MEKPVVMRVSTTGDVSPTQLYVDTRTDHSSRDNATNYTVEPVSSNTPAAATAAEPAVVNTDDDVDSIRTGGTNTPVNQPIPVRVVSGSSEVSTPKTPRHTSITTIKLVPDGDIKLSDQRLFSPVNHSRSQVESRTSTQKVVSEESHIRNQRRSETVERVPRYSHPITSPGVPPLYPVTNLTRSSPNIIDRTMESGSESEDFPRRRIFSRDYYIVEIRRHMYPGAPPNYQPTIEQRIEKYDKLEYRLAKMLQEVDMKNEELKRMRRKISKLERKSESQPFIGMGGSDREMLLKVEEEFGNLVKEYEILKMALTTSNQQVQEISASNRDLTTKTFNLELDVQRLERENNFLRSHMRNESPTPIRAQSGGIRVVTPSPRQARKQQSAPAARHIEEGGTLSRTFTETLHSGEQPRPSTNEPVRTSRVPIEIGYTPSPYQADDKAGFTDTQHHRETRSQSDVTRQSGRVVSSTGRPLQVKTYSVNAVPTTSTHVIMRGENEDQISPNRQSAFALRGSYDPYATYTLPRIRHGGTYYDSLRSPVRGDLYAPIAPPRPITSFAPTRTSPPLLRARPMTPGYNRPRNSSWLERELRNSHYDLAKRERELKRLEKKYLMQKWKQERDYYKFPYRMQFEDDRIF